MIPHTPKTSHLTKIVAATTFAAAGLTACSKHTELTVHVEGDEVSQSQIARITSTIAAPVEATKFAEGAWHITFKGQVRADEQAVLRGLLDRAIRVSGRPPPTVALEITEQNDDTLEASGAGEVERNRELKLQLDRGERALLTEGAGMSRQQLCAWHVPVDGGIPDLGYSVAVDTDKATNPQMREALEKLQEGLAGLALTAGHEIIFDPADSAASAQHVKLMPPDALLFVFDSESSPDLGTPLGSMAFQSDFAECAQKVLAGCDDAFFATFMFPGLSTALKSYELADVRF